MLPCPDDITPISPVTGTRSWQVFDDAHGAQRVRHHDAHELFRRHVRDRFSLVVRRVPCIDEQRVEGPARQPAPQGFHLGRLSGCSSSSISTRPWAPSAKSCSSVRVFPPLTVPTTVHPFLRYSAAMACPRPREAPMISMVLPLLSGVCGDMVAISCGASMPSHDGSCRPAPDRFHGSGFDAGASVHLLILQGHCHFYGRFSPSPTRARHARLSFPHHHPRPQHGRRPRPVARHRHEGRRLRQADHRRRQLLHPVRARPRPPEGPRPARGARDREGRRRRQGVQHHRGRRRHRHGP